MKLFHLEGVKLTQLGLDRNTPAAIIVGSDNMPQMGRTVEDDQFAVGLLRNFVQEMFGVIDTYYAQPPIPCETRSMNPHQAKRLLVDIVVLTAIDEVREPDTRAFRADPK